VASLSQGRTAAAQCGLFTYKSVPVIFEPPCISFLPSTVLVSVLFKHTLSSLMIRMLVHSAFNHLVQLLGQKDFTEHLQGFLTFSLFNFPNTHKKSNCWLLGCDNFLSSRQVPTLLSE